VTPHLQRALLLQQQGRHDGAEAEFRQHLALEPEDAFAHAALAISLLDLGRRADAEATARRAIGLGPDIAFAHYALARVLSDRNREAEADSAIGEALRLEPDDADYHAFAAAIALDRGRWPQALEAAEQALAFDPEHVTANNLRAMALVKLGRKSEAGATLETALARDPEDALSHANRGWTLLHERQRDRAMEHFREALRLEPGNDWARVGLVEAIKAGNPVYAVVLGYFLWMQRLSPGARWGMLIGGYFGFRIVGNLARSNPALAPWLLPVQIAYIAFALLTWLAVPLFNTLLFFHPVGRHALAADQRWQARLTTACVVPALGALAIWLGAGMEGRSLVAALVFGLLALPVAAVHQCQRGWPRWAMGGIAAVLAITGLAALAILLPGDSPLTSQAGHAGRALLGFFLLASFASQWIANGLMGVRPKR